MRQNKFTGTKEYTLYTFLVEDELGNIEEVDSLRNYDIGTRVEIWFDDKYNKTKMRPYQQKRGEWKRPPTNNKLGTTSAAKPDEIDRIDEAVHKYTTKH